MKVTLQAQASFKLKVTRDHVEMLILYANNHYDETCRSAALPSKDQHHPFAGLLIGWRNTIDFWEDAGKPENDYVTATDRQIDLLQKCIEFTWPRSTPEQEVLRHELKVVFGRCRKQWHDVYDKWRIEWDTFENGLIHG